MVEVGGCGLRSSLTNTSHPAALNSHSEATANRRSTSKLHFCEPVTRGIFSPNPTPTTEGEESHGDVSSPARSAPLEEHFLRPLVMSPRALKPLSCDAVNEKDPD